MFRITEANLKCSFKTSYEKKCLAGTSNYFETILDTKNGVFLRNSLKCTLARINMPEELHSYLKL